MLRQPAAMLLMQLLMNIQQAAENLLITSYHNPLIFNITPEIRNTTPKNIEYTNISGGRNKNNGTVVIKSSGVNVGSMINPSPIKIIDNPIIHFFTIINE